MNSIIRIRAAGILVKKDQVLLVRHEKNGRSYWLFPGGGVNYGESVEQALIREFKEECELNISIGPLVLVHDSIPPDGHRQVLNLYFTVKTSDDNLRTGKDSVMKEARYHRLNGLANMTIYPKVIPFILGGIRTGWADGCRYLGNVWDD